VLAGMKMAKQKGCTTLAFTSTKGAGMEVDIRFAVPATEPARIQEIHILLGHMLCGALEQELGLVAKGGAA